MTDASFPTNYKSIVLREDITVRKLYSVHYFEYCSDFAFPGESHDFWELVYVDKGEILVSADDKVTMLRKGEILFHPPLEFHSLRANGIVAPNLIVIGFGTDSEAMKALRQYRGFLKPYQRAWLAELMEESLAAFSSPLDDPTLKVLHRRSIPLRAGAEQRIKLFLELLLLDVKRSEDTAIVPLPAVTIFCEQRDSELVAKAKSFMEENLQTCLTLEELCRVLHVGRSRLQKLFRQQTGGGPMDYFNQCKIQAAKGLLREGGRTVTEIAESLGFSSLYYFSRQFKKGTGMSPREYASSIKVKTSLPYQRKKQ